MNIRRHIVLLILIISGVTSCKRNHPIPVSGIGASNTGEKFDSASVADRIMHNMILVQGGEFTMGCVNDQDATCEDNEKPTHDVTVGDFYLSRYDVTAREFECFVKEVGYKSSAENQGFSCLGTDAVQITVIGLNWRCNKKCVALGDDEKDNPVLFVSWYDAVEFCRWLSIKTGRKFRLPTSAEYEFAARGGVKAGGYKYAGSDSLNEVAWYKDNSGGNVHPVGKKLPNELGLYDMMGLVYQWCSDWDSDSAVAGNLIDPKGPENGTFKVIRGGAVNRPATFQRFSLIHSRIPGFSNGNCGFRVAMDM